MDFVTNSKICSFTLTQELFDFLTERNIYFYDQRKIRDQQDRRFFFMRDVRLGPFSSVLRGTEIISIGSYSYSHSFLRHTMSVGNYCSIASGLATMGNDHPFERFSTGSFTYDRQFLICADSAADLPGRFQPVGNPKHAVIKAQIDHDVWIGGQVLLSNSIRIGTGAIVAAGSVVTKDVAPYDIVGGNPARVIRKRFPTEICERLLATEWYHYHFPYFKGVDVREDIATSIAQIELVLATGEVPRIKTPPLLIDVLSEYEGRNLSYSD